MPNSKVPAAHLTKLLTLIDMLLHSDKAKSGFSLMVMSSQNHGTPEQIHLLADMVIILTIIRIGDVSCRLCFQIGYLHKEPDGSLLYNVVNQLDPDAEGSLSFYSPLNGPL